MEIDRERENLIFLLIIFPLIYTIRNLVARQRTRYETEEGEFKIPLILDTGTEAILGRACQTGKQNPSASANVIQVL